MTVWISNSYEVSRGSNSCHVDRYMSLKLDRKVISIQMRDEIGGRLDHICIVRSRMEPWDYLHLGN